MCVWIPHDVAALLRNPHLQPTYAFLSLKFVCRLYGYHSMALCNLVVVFLRIISSYPFFQGGVGARSKWRWSSSSHGLDGTIDCVSFVLPARDIDRFVSYTKGCPKGLSGHAPLMLKSTIGLNK